MSRRETRVLLDPGIRGERSLLARAFVGHEQRALRLDGDALGLAVQARLEAGETCTTSPAGVSSAIARSRAASTRKWPVSASRVMSDG